MGIAQVLEVHKGNLALALTEYDEARRPEMHALAHMDLIAPEVILPTTYLSCLPQSCITCSLLPLG